MEDVGDHQEPIGRLEHGGVSLLEGEQLIERIDFHELQARGREDLGARHDRLGGREHAVGAGVAVADGIGKQRAVAAQKREVDAPRIDAHGLHRRAMPVGGQPQPPDHLVPEPDEIPDQLPGEHHGPILEAMNLLELEKPAVERSRHHPSAGGPQVDCQCYGPRHAPLLLKCGGTRVGFSLTAATARVDKSPKNPYR